MQTCTRIHPRNLSAPAALTVARVAQLSSSQAEDVVRLFRATYGEQYHAAFTTTGERLQQEIRKLSATLFVALQGDVVAGFALLAPDPWGGVKYQRAIVSEMYRGRRIGSRLLTAATDWAQTAGKTMVWAEAVTSHQASERSFSAQGFAPVGVHLGKFNDYFSVGRRESTIVFCKRFREKPSAHIDAGRGGLQIGSIDASRYAAMRQVQIDATSLQCGVQQLTRLLMLQASLFPEPAYEVVHISVDNPAISDITQLLNSHGFFFASELPGTGIRGFQRVQCSGWHHLFAVDGFSCGVSQFLVDYADLLPEQVISRVSVGGK